MGIRMSDKKSSPAFGKEEELAINTIRILAAEMVQKANSGHPGMPMGFASVAHVLWSRFLKFSPEHPFWPGRDRFILSCGHGSALQYALLHLAGYDLDMEELKQFRQLGSRTAGHPEYGLLPGVETTTGPLGQGFANTVGMAAAQQYIRAVMPSDEGEFDPFDHRFYVVVSDGDLQEGISYEAAALAGLWKLGNIVALYDANNISIDGTIDLTWSENPVQRFEACGWHVQEVLDGHDPSQIYDAIEKARQETEKPSIIVFHTHIGFGSPNKQDSSSSHGAPLGVEEIELTKKALGWDYPEFTVPEETYAIYAEAADRGREEHKTWLENISVWLKARPERKQLWQELIEGDVPIDLNSIQPEFETGSKMATRGASGIALNQFAEKLISMIGGCADLNGSVKTDIKKTEIFSAESYGGRNIRFGVREHTMGSIAVGMCLYANLRAFTGTFLVFSDYMRPTIRTAALMKLPVIFVFSHDSIGVGEDGPTHQPIEHVAALRAIPGVNVYRPGDANEMFHAWRNALETTDQPSVIISTRQGLPVLDRSKYAPADLAGKGAYILKDSNGVPDLIFMASGSEVSLIVEAQKRLEEEKIKVRVVSMPSWELFREQSEEYKNSVLPSSVKSRLAVEAGIAQGWHEWIGDEGKFIGMNSFGESAPGAVLFEKFGFTVDNVVETAKSLIDKK